MRALGAGKKHCEYLCLGGPIMLNTVLVCGLGGGRGPLGVVAGVLAGLSGMSFQRNDGT